MLSAGEQLLAVQLVGDPDGTLLAAVTTIANQYNYDARYPGMGLDLLYVQRDLIKVAMGTVRDDVSIKDPDQSEDRNKRFEHLATMQANVTAEIAERTSQARGTGRAAVGQLRAINPVQPPYPAPFPDASDPRYAGSPYVRAYQPEKN